MKFSSRSAALFSSLCLLFVLPAAKAQDDDEFKVKLLPVTPEMEAAAAKAMQGCPWRGGKISGAINKNGVYTLTGDLFHDGSIYAVVDDKENVILCEWQKTKWNPVTAININPVWKFPGFDLNNDGREPYATMPFWMMDLQGHPLLAIATIVEKGGQNFDVILFDSKAKANFGYGVFLQHGSTSRQRQLSHHRRLLQCEIRVEGKLLFQNRKE